MQKRDEPGNEMYEIECAVWSEVAGDVDTWNNSGGGRLYASCERILTITELYKRMKRGGKTQEERNMLQTIKRGVPRRSW